jgi:hypothetical protein
MFMFSDSSGDVCYVPNEQASDPAAASQLPGAGSPHQVEVSARAPHSLCDIEHSIPARMPLTVVCVRQRTDMRCAMVYL